jgi:2-polyprenyl-6-hydroxyphenyl methylase/3-demethylubiquinone-9 3-methyltransferase
LSIDPQEVAYYQRLADTWWDEQGPFWPLHRLNELRSRYLHEAICEHFGRDPQRASPLEGLEMIDVGCGGGILSESMARLGASVYGIDVVEKNIAVAHSHSQGSGLPVDYELVSAEDLASRGRQYDVVLNMEVVEHVADLPGFLSACSRMVAPQGMMFIATINRTFLSWLFAIVGAEYILRWLPKGTHSWKKFPRPEELEQLLARDGVKVTERLGVRVNPVTRGFGLTSWLGVNYMLKTSR